MGKIEKYLDENWEKCIKENRESSGSLIGLPYKYTIPSAGHFNELYYWDTYFTNVGLLQSGRAELAKSNTDNMLYLVNKYGFMPNGNRTFFLNRSQPPFLSEMVKDVYEYYKDEAWLSGAYSVLETEYKFWTEKRGLPIGLSHYGNITLTEKASVYVNEFKNRIASGYEDKTELEIARHSHAMCESGWDMNPRWEFEAYNYVQVDLNSLLYGFENNMAYFAEILGRENSWKERAEKRLEAMNKYMLTDDGIFLDYNFAKNTKSSVFSAASYFPLYAGAATKEQARALADKLGLLEEKYGVCTCEKQNDGIDYQWGYPNGWACLQFIVIKGFLNYGYDDIAKRIAKKYVDLAEKVFDETGNLWEKYNVVDGNINVKNEYEMPPMLGWSAGVYIYSKNLLERK